ncbi:RPOLD domain-containing protein [Mycena indigotica]|uniref:DNA-directed RNA polymerases I and III subunit RPAC1 n=1 Tax=Mycena indigotica TaxID=2126181 RepID=A0A8H6TEL4_9AGAR|nr:RPOLD domain-containing protein [Mycena indigotica]KAF7315311.1 RPOLD domain-containing protein [Mycena indigotica]
MSIDPRRLVGIKAERVTDVSSRDFPGYYPDEDNSWNLDAFKENLTVKIYRVSNRSIDFDLVGVDASIANAFRRIMIAEVPTVTIESVYVYNNTSVVVDEVLSQRIGLIPLNVDPAMMEMRVGDEATDRNTLVFTLTLGCTRRKDAPKDSTDPAQLYENHELLSRHLLWEPAGEQEAVFAAKPPGPLNPDIVLAKLRPGQQIEMTLHAIKGVGKDHAKFSPVATASYRLLPHINIKKTIPPHLAEKFQNCFSPGVIRVDPRTKAVSVDEQGVRNDTVSREVLRHPEFEGSVELGRVRDHFLFNIESESAYPPQRLLLEAISVMRDKIANIKRAAEALLDRPADEDVTMG